MPLQNSCLNGRSIVPDQMRGPTHLAAQGIREGQDWSQVCARIQLEGPQGARGQADPCKSPDTKAELLQYASRCVFERVGMEGLF